MRVPVADSLFLQYGQTAKLGGENRNVPPTCFEWVAAPVDSARFVTDSDLKHAPGSGQVALLLETFFLHPDVYVTAMEKPFDYVLTHNRYFARHKDWLWYPHGGSWVALDSWKVHPKSKNVSILLSPKRTLAGHKLFHQVVETYRDKFDGVFGLEYYASKLEALAQFRFAVIIEAEKNESFFSEKLIDCLSVGTIPIYWGAPDIERYFNPLGILQVETLEQIGDVLENASPALYRDRLEYVKVNLELARSFAIPEDWIYRNYPFLFEAR